MPTIEEVILGSLGDDGDDGDKGGDDGDDNDGDDNDYDNGGGDGDDNDDNDGGGENEAAFAADVCDVDYLRRRISRRARAVRDGRRLLRCWQPC